MNETNGHETLDFDDYEARPVPVRFRGKDYLLREAPAGVAAAHHNFVLKHSRIVDGRLVPSEGSADAQSLLVAGCLVQLAPQKDGTVKECPVIQAEVKGWPDRVVKTLYDRAKDLSRMEEEVGPEALERQAADLSQRAAALRAAGDPAKNVPAATGSTSS